MKIRNENHSPHAQHPHRYDGECENSEKRSPYSVEFWRFVCVTSEKFIVNLHNDTFFTSASEANKLTNIEIDREVWLPPKSNFNRKSTNRNVKLMKRIKLLLINLLLLQITFSLFCKNYPKIKKSSDKFLVKAI